MSASGVLIEAAVLPEPKTRIFLKRGSLEAAGVVAWRQGRRAGIAFEAAIHVSEWMSRQVASHQDRVDQIVSTLKTGKLVPSGLTLVPGAGAAIMSIEAELLVLRTELEALETGLIADLSLVSAHPEIQLLDVSVQRIGRILARLDRAA